MGCVSSSIFPEYEPYGAVLNTIVLSKESVYLSLKEFSGKYVALLMSLEQLGGILCMY